MSRGTASGQRDVEEAAGRAGLGAHGRRRRAERVGQASRQEVRRREEHDAEVLGQVARILDGPVGVIAERRVAGRLEAVQVVVGRVEEMAGRDEVVGEEQADRDGRPEAGGPAPPPRTPARPRRAAKNGAANDDGQPGRAGRGRTGARPTNWRRSMANRRRAGPTVGEPGRAVRPVVGELGLVGLPRIRAEGERRSASSVRPTATMWAWYQVVASWAAVPEDRPEGEEDRRREPDRRAGRRGARASTSRARRRSRRGS